MEQPQQQQQEQQEQQGGDIETASVASSINNTSTNTNNASNNSYNNTPNAYNTPNTPNAYNTPNTPNAYNTPNTPNTYNNVASAQQQMMTRTVFMENIPFHWSETNENILAEWCDVAQCYRWMYLRAYNHYSTIYNALTISVIVFSTMSGAISYTQNSLSPTNQHLLPFVIGTVNLGVGLISTIQNYLKIAETKEAFRTSGIAWDKLSRNIKIELAKSQEERTQANVFFKDVRQEYDRLMENSPIVPQRIVSKFNKKFKGTEYDHIHKPAICSHIHIRSTRASTVVSTSANITPQMVIEINRPQRTTTHGVCISPTTTTATTYMADIPATYDNDKKRTNSLTVLYNKLFPNTTAITQQHNNIPPPSPTQNDNDIEQQHQTHADADTHLLPQINDIEQQHTTNTPPHDNDK